MAILSSRTLFFVTSPRSPMKMQPEIQLLIDQLKGKSWNKANQILFANALAACPSFKGRISKKDPAFSSRDRVNRAPKSLGFVNLEPEIELTDVGKLFLDSCFEQETLLRQLLKFQLPSPYHQENENNQGLFWVKPYLEIFRLIQTLGKITFDELMMFGLQLTNYNKFDEIVKKIESFRLAKQRNCGSYKTFLGYYLQTELEAIYAQEIAQGNTKTRESRDSSPENFIKTKASNMRDYADACCRYLMATGYVVSQRGKSFLIREDKKDEVAYFLQNVGRDPVYVRDEEKYKKYLFDACSPTLYGDELGRLQSQIRGMNFLTEVEIQTSTITVLKKKKYEYEENHKLDILNNKIRELKEQQHYKDIEEVFDGIAADEFYDTPLMLEWNSWRAMTMMDGGDIQANLKFDVNGDPASTAVGNVPDILCTYEDFILAVEVTMQRGQRQYESESEPVSRHLGNIQKEAQTKGLPAYCFFIAPKINDATIVHFFILNKTSVCYYGGTLAILPIELNVFRQMLKKSYEAGKQPDSQKIKNLCDFSVTVARTAENEKEWYEAVKNKAINWLQ